MTTGATVFAAVAGGLFAVAYTLQLVRWLRVLERERFRPGSVLTFYFRWASPASVSATAVRHTRTISSRVFAAPFAATDRFIDARVGGTGAYRADPKKRHTQKPISFSLVVAVLLVLTLATRAAPVTLFFALVYALVFPWGMPLRGRPRPLAWTPRLRAVAVVAVALSVAIGAVAVVVHHVLVVAAAELLLVPLVVELAGTTSLPFHHERAVRSVHQAVEHLQRVHPTVVAIYGSAGDPSTSYLTWALLDRRSDVVRFDAVYWNGGELASALASGIDVRTRVVLVGLGADRRGEISEMSSWCVPDVAVVTSISADRLELVGSMEQIEDDVFAGAAQAKTVVVSAAISHAPQRIKQLQSAGLTVLRASVTTGDGAVVERVEGEWAVSYNGDRLASVAPIRGASPATLACAVATAVALGVRTSDIATLLGGLAPVPTATAASVAPNGMHIVIAVAVENLAGAHGALAALADVNAMGRRVVVTPGFVELGTEQGAENYKLGALVASAGAELIAIARTNAEALLDGFGSHARRFDARQQATAWVRHNLGGDDAVLYLGEIGDHYP